jgi:uncharacterized protein (DUF433 family)
MHGMIDWTQCPEVETSTDTVSGAPVFAGSRVPISALFENLEDGVTILEFTRLFPGIRIEQVKAVLDFAARKSLTTV